MESSEEIFSETTRRYAWWKRISYSKSQKRAGWLRQYLSTSLPLNSIPILP